MIWIKVYDRKTKMVILSRQVALDVAGQEFMKTYYDFDTARYCVYCEECNAN